MEKELDVLLCSTLRQHTSTTAYRSCEKRDSRVVFPSLTLYSEKLKAKYDEEVAQKPRGMIFNSVDSGCLN
jgi:hypothetical protein